MNLQQQSNTFDMESADWSNPLATYLKAGIKNIKCARNNEFQAGMAIRQKIRRIRIPDSFADSLHCRF